MLRSAIVAVLLLAVTPAWAMECTLSPDRSEVLITAGNTTGDALRCTSRCLVKRAGERLFEDYQCTYNLEGIAASKVVCRNNGGEAGAFTDVLPKNTVCNRS